MPPVAIVVGEQPPSLMIALVQRACPELAPFFRGQGGACLPGLRQDRQQECGILIVLGWIARQACCLQFHEDCAKDIRARDDADLAVDFHLDSLRSIECFSTARYFDCSARRGRGEICSRTYVIWR